MAEQTGNPTFDELSALATQAQWDGRFADGIELFAGAILLKGGVPIEVGEDKYKLSNPFDRKVAYVTERAELAIPKEVFGWDVQRVRVDRIEVGKKEHRPGYFIDEIFNLGHVCTTIVSYDGDRRIRVQADEWAEESVFRKVGSKSDVCSVMNLAAHQGIVIPERRHGKRTVREGIRSGSAYVGMWIAVLASAEDD